MEYIKKSSLEAISLGEGEGSVYFDSDTGDTHILDDVASDILTCFKTGSSIDIAVDNLANIYGTKRSDIENDVKEFVENLISKGLLVAKEG